MALKITPLQPSIQNSPINLVALREFSLRELTQLLDNVKGKKTLVLDPTLSGPLGLIAKVQLLKEHGVESILLLNPGKQETESNVVYMCRPKTEYMNIIADQVLENTRNKQQKQYTLLFVPRRSIVCEQLLKARGVLGDIAIDHYQLDFIPFDEDLLSMELDTSFRECFLDGDPSCLYPIANALFKLQSLFGVIPHIKGKGDMARQVCRLLMRLRREAGEVESAPPIPEIQQLVIIDRTVDMVTPMLTPHTFEALIDEVFELKNGYISVAPEVLFGKKADPEKKPPVPVGADGKCKLALNSMDILYRDIRGMPFARLGGYLARKAQSIAETYEERHKAMTVQELSQFMKKFKNVHQEHGLLQIHINIAESIAAQETQRPPFGRQISVEQDLLAGQDAEQYLEELIGKQEPIVRVLKTLSLMSVTQGGLKQKKLDYFRREILQTYGFELLLTLMNMEKVGLLKRQDTKSPWPALKDRLQLVVEGQDSDTPNDLSYVFSGYAPLSCRLVEMACKETSWRNEEILQLLPGDTFEYIQDAGMPVPEAKRPPTTSSGPTERKNPCVLVLFIGGVTFSEIAALRFLAESQSFQRDLIIATTKICNGSAIVRQLNQPIENKLDKRTL